MPKTTTPAASPASPAMAPSTPTSLLPKTPLSTSLSILRSSLRSFLQPPLRKRRKRTKKRSPDSRHRREYDAGLADFEWGDGADFYSGRIDCEKGNSAYYPLSVASSPASESNNEESDASESPT